MPGHSHDNTHASANTGNILGDRSSVRQSKLYRQYESGNDVKGILGTENLQWRTDKKEGVYEGHTVYDHADPYNEASALEPIQGGGGGAGRHRRGGGGGSNASGNPFKKNTGNATAAASRNITHRDRGLSAYDENLSQTFNKRQADRRTAAKDTGISSSSAYETADDENFTHMSPERPARGGGDGGGGSGKSQQVARRAVAGVGAGVVAGTGGAGNSRQKQPTKNTARAPRQRQQKATHEAARSKGSREPSAAGAGASLTAAQRMRAKVLLQQLPENSNSTAHLSDGLDALEQEDLERFSGGLHALKAMAAMAEDAQRAARLADLRAELDSLEGEGTSSSSIAQGHNFGLPPSSPPPPRGPAAAYSSPPRSDNSHRSSHSHHSNSASPPSTSPSKSILKNADPHAPYRAYSDSVVPDSHRGSHRGMRDGTHHTRSGRTPSPPARHQASTNHYSYDDDDESYGGYGGGGSSSSTSHAMPFLKIDQAGGYYNKKSLARQRDAPPAPLQATEALQALHRQASKFFQNDFNSPGESSQHMYQRQSRTLLETGRGDSVLHGLKTPRDKFHDKDDPERVPSAQLSPTQRLLRSAPFATSDVLALQTAGIARPDDRRAGDPEDYSHWRKLQQEKAPPARTAETESKRVTRPW